MARLQTGWRRPRWSATSTASALAVVVTVGFACLLCPGAIVLAQDASPSGLGRPPTEAELRDNLVGPDGADLPWGMAPQRRGRLCSSGDWPISHWPFAPSVWDYIHRVVPYDRPGILTIDETYAVTAFLLFRNGIIDEGDVMDADSLPMVEMPHRNDYVAPEPGTPDTRRGFAITPVR